MRKQREPRKFRVSLELQANSERTPRNSPFSGEFCRSTFQGVSGIVLYCLALLDNIAIEYSKIDRGLIFQAVNESIFAPVKSSQAKFGAVNALYLT